MLKMSKAETGKLPEGQRHESVSVTDAKSAIRWLKKHAVESSQRETVTLIAADRFLVKHGFLSGEPTLQMPASEEELVPTP
jgi:phage host-nuclease inhibitor protein Gam